MRVVAADHKLRISRQRQKGRLLISESRVIWALEGNNFALRDLSGLSEV
jgi:hypothetical protein